MRWSLIAASLLFAGVSGASLACPDAKSKEKTAGGEQNMSKPSAAFNKAQKPGRPITADSSGGPEKAEKADKPKV